MAMTKLEEEQLRSALLRKKNDEQAVELEEMESRCEGLEAALGEIKRFVVAIRNKAERREALYVTEPKQREHQGGRVEACLQIESKLQSVLEQKGDS